MDKGEEIVKKRGLTVLTATIFLVGEMAGAGALKLPNAMIGTGWTGAGIILLFTINSCYGGTRLGLCTNILMERYDEFRHEIRDPYPSIGEKAFGKIGRMVATICMIVTLWGACCVFISLIAGMFRSLLENIDGFHLGYENCAWMVIVTVPLIPLTWMGTPKDFWPMAVGALLTILTACVCVIVQGAMDYHDHIISNDNGADETCDEGKYVNGTGCEPIYPSPTADGFFIAFSSIMFAFGGAPIFPTIQADMKDRSKFYIAAMIGCGMLFFIYLPLAASGYYFYGNGANASIVESISHGGLRITAEVCFLIHLVSAFPIIFNPPTQYFEQLLNIPSDFNWKRVAFRTISVLIILFIAESIPDFGSILDLAGATSFTMTTFVCPPFFYMRLCDSSKQNDAWTERKIPVWERVYCYFLILFGIVGGCCATYAAVKNIVSTNFKTPCYLQ